VNLHAQTKGKFFEQILAPRFETSFFMLGWTPVTYDTHDAFINLMQTRDAKTQKGQFNVAGYSNPKFDELSDKIQVEVDKAKRTAMIAEATKLYTGDMVYIPLHQQTVIWATRKNVDLVLSADNIFQWRWVKMK
jgi:peptide/nickel transport system substrate-binding protein